MSEQWVPSSDEAGADPGTPMAGTAASLLRQAREASGLHLVALAAALKVPVRKLEALESGRYDELPDLTFARALAASVCRQLKMDPAPVLDQIPTAIDPALGDLPQSTQERFTAPGDAPPSGLLGRVLRPVPLLVALLLVVALALYLWPSAVPVTTGASALPPAAVGSHAGAGTSTAGSPAPVTLNPSPGALSPADAAPAGIASEPLASPPPAATASPTPTSAATVTTGGELSVAATTASPSAETSASAGTPAAGTVALNLVADGDSWVEVVNGRGETLLLRMLKAGDRVDLASVPPYALVVGRADMVRVTVRGQPLDITPYARNSVARFEVK